jgi:WD40 repeat protein
MHKGTLNSVALSPNLRFLLSTGADSFIKVWDYEFSLKGPGSA